MAKQANKALSNTEISFFCNQMAMILQSGISSIEGISIMLEDNVSPDGKIVLESIYHTLEETGNFHAAVSDCGVFPKYFTDMVEIGEQSGRLDDVMSSLAQYYEREENIAKGIKGAITYHCIMIGLLLFIVVILIVKVLPVFNQVYIELGSQLTGFSKSLLNLGNMLSHYAVPVIIVFAAFTAFLFFNGSKIRFSKTLQHKIAQGRFASGMFLTLSSGLDIEQSLTMTSKLVDNQDLQEKIKKCQTSMEEGESFSHAVTSSELFQGVYARMIAVGFKTGNVDEVMKKVADQYEEEVDNRIERLISILEPSLVVALSIIVGVILLSVMLPLMGIMSSIGPL